MIELQFEKKEVDLQGYGKVSYEWACQENLGVFRLVFHFFLRRTEEDVFFLQSLHSSGEKSVGNQCDVAVYYTKEFDGHDLILTGINPMSKLAIHNSVLDNLRKELSGDGC